MITVHADVVGSLLRPPELLQAQRQRAAVTVSPARFKEIENRAAGERGQALISKEFFVKG